MDVKAFAPIAREHHVFPACTKINNLTWRVASASRPGHWHTVDMQAGTGMLSCGCEWGRRGRSCIHSTLVSICTGNLDGAGKLAAIERECAKGLERAAATIAALTHDPAAEVEAYSEADQQVLASQVDNLPPAPALAMATPEQIVRLEQLAADYWGANVLALAQDRQCGRWGASTWPELTADQAAQLIGELEQSLLAEAHENAGVDISVLRQELAEARTEAAECARELRLAIDDIAELQREIAGLRTQIEGLVSELNAGRQIAGALEAERNLLAQQLAEVKTAPRRQRSRAVAAVHEADQLDSAIRTFTARVADPAAAGFKYPPTRRAQ